MSTLVSIGPFQTGETGEKAARGPIHLPSFSFPYVSTIPERRNPPTGATVSGKLIALGYPVADSDADVDKVTRGVIANWPLSIVLTIHMGRGVSVLRNSYSAQMRGSHAYELQYTAIVSGSHGIILTRYEGHRARGASILRAEFGENRGLGHFAQNLSLFTLQGRGAHELEVSYTPTARGVAGLVEGFSGKARGKAAVSAQFAIEARGNHQIDFTTYPMRARGVFGLQSTVSINIRGLSRVANDALDVYELYRGVGQEPDLTAAPWQTFTALPFQTPALSASTTYYFILRKRNAYGLISKNIDSFRLELDSGSEQETTKPSAPTSVAIAPAAAGAVLVSAEYQYAEDGANQATQFLVYLTSNGVDPDPLIDTPTVVTMSKFDGVAKLAYTSSTFGDGQTMKAIVRTRRIDAGPTNVDSDNSNVVATLADTDGPAAPNGDVFFGRVASQRIV